MARSKNPPVKKKGGQRWLTGPDGKKFRVLKGEKNKAAHARQIRHLKKIQIVDLLNEGWSLRNACGVAGYHHSTVYAWKDDDEDFDSKVRAAMCGAIGRVECKAFQEAMKPEGVQDRRLILRTRGQYAFEPPPERKQDEVDEAPNEVEIELVDGDGNPLFETEE